MCLNGKMHGLLGSGPPTVKQFDPLVAVISEISLKGFTHYSFYPFSPIHRSHICVSLTDGTARIFTTNPLFYLSRIKSPVSRVTPSHWEREIPHCGVLKRIGALKIFSWVRVPCLAACVTGECFINCTMPLRQVCSLHKKLGIQC